MNRSLLLAAVSSAFLMIAANPSWGSPAVRLLGRVIDTSSAVAKNKKSGLPADKIASEAPIRKQAISARGTLPYLVQFTGPIREEWKASLKAAGADIKGYVPDNAFLVEANPDKLDRISRIEAVQWIGEYRADYKIQPRLKSLVGHQPAVPKRLTLDTRLSAKDSTDIASDAAVVTITTFAPADVDPVAKTVQAFGGKVLRTAKGERRGLIRAQVPIAGVEALSALGDVEWIEEFVPHVLHNNVAQDAPRMNVALVQTNYRLTGTNQVIGIADTGLDTGNLGTLHPDFTNRVKATYALGRPGDWSDTDGHGTHTSGSILGDGRAYSNGLFHGTAYGAQLVFQSVMDAEGGLGGIPADLNDLFIQPYTNGARIHSDSWGSSMNGYYSVDCENTDAFMWNHPDMLVVFSAGNDGLDGTHSGVISLHRMGAPGTSKNILTVGAAESRRPAGSGGYSATVWGTGTWRPYYPVSPISNDLISTSADGTNQGMAAFSSRGPCNDGRIKPDIVAPGTDIISCRSRAPGAGVGWGTGSGVLGNSSSNYYVFMGGTSMSTPLTAGAAALARQYLMERRGFTNPSAALVKATLINGARSLTPGQYGTGAYKEIPSAPRPNNVEGWGQIDLGEALFPSSGNTNIFLDTTNSLTTGATNVHTFTVSGANRLSVTLAWTDYPATLSAAAKLVNDLDLLVIFPDGTTNYAFGRSDFDRINNVEGLDLDPAPQGTLTFKVIGYNVPYGPQPYALAIRTAMTSACAKAVSPAPAHNETGVSRSARLSWGNACGATNFGVYFGTNATPGAGEFKGAQDATWFDPGVLDYRTTYYWRIDANTPSGTMTGDVWSFTTEAPVVFSEGFENGGAIPAGWTQTNTAGDLDWVFIDGGFPGWYTPSSAHSGSYNACLYTEDSGLKTRLISPAINFGPYSNNTELTFWLYMQGWGLDQDLLRVYYRTNAAAAWTSLTNYLTSTTPWTKRTVALPRAGAEYYLAFEGEANYGYGVCIDDIQVTGMGDAGILSGTVSNALTGQAIPNALITVSNSHTHSQSNGAYSLGLIPGAYSVVASAANYSTSAPVDVVVASGSTTAQDFALSPIPLQVSPMTGFSFGGPQGGPFTPTGQVYILTNASLAPLAWTATCASAWLDISARGGTLNAGDSLPVTVAINYEADFLPAGSHTATLVFSNMTDGGIQIRPNALTVQTLPPTPLIYADFSGGLPAGWAVTGSGPVWRFDDPDERGNLTGGSNGFAIADSDYAGEVAMDTVLRTLSVNCSSLANAEFQFKTDFQYYDDEIADVDVSTNGAAGPWVNLWRKTGVDVLGPTNIVLNVTAQTVGKTNVMFRFHYYNANWDWWWEVDDVQFGGTFGGGNPAIMPPTDLNASGYHGGPFAPERIYRLTNTNLAELSWTSRCAQAWIDITPAGGTLASGAFTDVTVRVNSSANTLTPGAYTNQAVFSNITDGTAQTRAVSLSIVEPLSVSPTNGLSATGYEGGPFAPTSIVYTLSNAGSNALAWTAVQTQSWLELSSAGGTLEAGASTSVTAALTGAADALPPGNYSNTVVFSNTNSGTAHIRSATLAVWQLPGKIEILDSIPPYNDTNMPFGMLIVGQTRTERITITNADATYPLVISNIAVQTAAGGAGASIHIARFTGNIARANEPKSIGRAPKSAQANAGGFQPMAAPSTVPCYGLDIYSDAQLISFSSATPGTLTPIGSSISGNPLATDFLNGDFSKLYALDNDAQALITINTTNGVKTFIGAAIPAAGQNWTGLAGDPSEGTLYAASTDISVSRLYRINPATGAATGIGIINNAPAIIAIAVNAAGRMYGLDIAGNNLISIDKTTGAGTIVGSVGVNANYAQGMDFDEVNDILYWASYTTNAALRVIDTTTGASAPIGPFPADTEIEMAVANGGLGAFRLTNAPSLPCSIPANTSVTFEVVYAPQTSGSNAAFVLIDSNDTNKPQVAVSLSGTAKAPQTIHFDNPGTQITTNTVRLAATASSGLPVSFAVLSGPGTISGSSNLTFTGSGTVSIVASQTGNVSWAAAPNATQTFNVVKAGQTITFPAIPDQVVTNRVTLSATASSGLPVTFAVVSGPAELLASPTLTFTGTGAVTVAAAQLGNAIWNAATPVTRSFTVLPATAPICGVIDADFDGDRLADPTTYDERTGTWITKLSGSGYATLTLPSLLGGPGYKAAVGDYDGDRFADPTVFQEATGNWIVMRSGSGYARLELNAFLGGPGWTPASANYTGDQRWEFGVYQETGGSAQGGNWKIKLGWDQFAVQIDLYEFLGGPGYCPAPADFDGDGLADPAVYNDSNGNWKVLLSSAGYSPLTLPSFLGGTGWTAVPADYDGDGLADPSVRNADGSEWRIMLSGSGYVTITVPLDL